MTIEDYTRQHQIALAHAIRPRAKVYLDLCFWIRLRDVMSGRSSDVKAIALLAVLRSGVARGCLICPISESTFMELTKQTDPSSRMATARLIDDLSLGVSLASIDHRAETEIEHFLQGAAPRAPLPDLEDLVWSKLSFALGFVYPILAGIRPEAEAVAQRKTFDTMWNMSLAGFLSALGDAAWPSGESFDQLAVDLNKGHAEHVHELRSYEQTYKNELRGAVDFFGNIAADVLAAAAAKHGHAPPARDSASWRETLNGCKNLMYAALEQGPARKTLRTIHIQAALHAHLRWNKKQKFDANDFYDFSHAAAALGYCDAFFTDGPFQVMVTASTIRLDQLRPCRVASTPVAALRIANGLVRSRA